MRGGDPRLAQGRGGSGGGDPRKASMADPRQGGVDAGKPTIGEDDGDAFGDDGDDDDNDDDDKVNVLKVTMMRILIMM